MKKGKIELRDAYTGTYNKIELQRSTLSCTLHAGNRIAVPGSPCIRRKLNLWAGERSCRDTPSPCIDQERHLRTRKLDRNGECGIVSRRRIDRGEELPARNRYIGGVRSLQGRRNVAQGWHAWMVWWLSTWNLVVGDMKDWEHYGIRINKYLSLFFLWWDFWTWKSMNN